MAVPNSNFATDFIASTLRHYEKSLRSTILDSTITLKMLKEKAMDEVGGGRELAYPIIYDDNDTFKSYEQDDDLDLSIQDGLTQSNYAWRQYSGSIVVTGIDLFRNSDSKAKIVDLLEYKTKQLSDSVSYKLTTDLHSAQSGTNINGLVDLIASSNNTVGGINSSTYSFWRNQKYSTATFGTTINGNGMVQMNQMMRDCAPEGKNPDLILTSSFLFGAIEQALVANQRFLRSEAKWGFDSMPFKGADIFWDSQCTSGHLKFIQSKDIRLVFGKGARFSLSPKVEPANKDVKVWNYITYLNLVAKNRRTSGLIYGVTSL